MTPTLIITGGQTGADLGGNFGALAAKVPTRANIFEGFAPIGRFYFPLQVPYNCLNIPVEFTYARKLAIRTRHNVEVAQRTLIFVDREIEKTAGSLLTMNYAIERRKPLLVIRLDSLHGTAQDFAEFIAFDGVLNIAGSRQCNEEQVASLVAAALRKARELRA